MSDTNEEIATEHNLVLAPGVEKWAFRCPDCRERAIHFIYPITHETDTAIGIYCDCHKYCFFSRKLKQLFDPTTNEECVPGSAILVEVF